MDVPPYPDLREIIMLRSMMQMYVKGSCSAVELYQKAFEATLSNEHKDENGDYIHAELNAFGQILAISEAGEERISGNTMQFCFHFGEGNEEVVEKAYDLLKDGAEISYPLGPCFFSPYMFGLIDKFGVNWCLFV